MRPALLVSNVRSLLFCRAVAASVHQRRRPHLLVVVLPVREIVPQGDPVAQLLAQSVQELVRVPAAGRAGESEQLLAAAEGVGTAVRELRGGRGAFQADVGVRVHAALVTDLVHRSGEGFLPGERQA